MSIKVTPLTGSLGALIEGADLTSRVTPEQLGVIHEAFLDHCVIVIRKQYLRPEAQLHFTKLWGKPVQNNPLSPALEGYPLITLVAKIPKATASTRHGTTARSIRRIRRRSRSSARSRCPMVATRCGATSTTPSSACLPCSA